MKIGEVAAAADTAAETIRFYEREGLLPRPSRTRSNYRYYDQVHLERLLFIRHCRSFDMSLNEVRVLLHFKDSPVGDCSQVNAMLDDHISHVARRIKELRTLEKELRDLRTACGESRQAQECGILGGLAQACDAPRKSRRENFRNFRNG